MTEARDWMDLNEAVEHVKKATGRTTHEARKAVVEAMRDGRLPVRGHVLGPGGEDLGLQEIPPEVFDHVVPRR